MHYGTQLLRVSAEHGAPAPIGSRPFRRRRREQCERDERLWQQRLQCRQQAGAREVRARGAQHITKQQRRVILVECLRNRVPQACGAYLAGLIHKHVGEAQAGSSGA